ATGRAPVAGVNGVRRTVPSHKPQGGGGWSRGTAVHQPEPAMSVARRVAEVLSDHVTLELESIDRMYLNVYVPRLQHEPGVMSFSRFHRGHPFASSALMGSLSTRIR